MNATNMTCLKCGIQTVTFAGFVPTCPVCGNGDCLFSLPKLDKIAKRYTASDTFADLCEACQPAGSDRQMYSPSIYVRDVNGRRNKPKAMLAAALRVAGYRVFDGSRCW